MDQNVSAMVQGLSNSLSGYLGMATQSYVNDKAETAKLAKQTAAKKSEIDYQQNAEGDRMIRTDKAKQAMEGQVDEDTANNLLPGSGDMVKSFKKLNGRNPTVTEAHSLIKAHPKSNGLSTVNPSTLAELMDSMGADPTQVESVRNLKEPLPTGLATKYFDHTMQGGLKEPQIWKLYTELNPGARSKTPDQLGEEWQKFKTGIMEPGKTAITSDAEFDKVSGAAEAVVQKAYEDTKSYEKALAIGASVIKKYDRASKRKLLLRISMHTRQHLAQPDQQPQQ